MMSEPAFFVERLLRVPAPSGIEQLLAARLHMPTQTQSEWRCRVAVHKDGHLQDEEEAYGEDGLQALCNGIVALERLVRQSFPTAKWVSKQDGDIGFPIIIQSFFPHHEWEQLRQVVEKTINDFTRSALERKKLENER